MVNDEMRYHNVTESIYLQIHIIVLFDFFAAWY